MAVAFLWSAQASCVIGGRFQPRKKNVQGGQTASSEGSSRRTAK